MLIFLKRDRIYFNYEFIADNPYQFIPELTAKTRLGIARMNDIGSWAVGVAYWWLVSTALVAAVGPWMRWGFGLRTLFVATTLVAIALACAMWAIG
jgi:hypothetical protein